MTPYQTEILHTCVACQEKEKKKQTRKSSKLKSINIFFVLFFFLPQIQFLYHLKLDLQTHVHIYHLEITRV